MRETDRTTKVARKSITKIPATILHRNVRRLVVLLPAEEQVSQDREMDE